MLKIGIVGAENSHCAAIAKLFNVEKRVAASVVAVWGEKRKYAEKAAAEGQVPLIVRDWREMLGKVDGVMIDHRHPKYHAEVATFFVESGVPCFIDKPFTFTLAEGIRLCRLARKKGVPIVSFSSIPLQKDFADFKKQCGKIGQIVSLTTTGPSDLKNNYGGVFFYGIHQADSAVALLGVDVDRVVCRPCGNNAAAVVTWRSGAMAAMNLVADTIHTFHWQATGQKEVIVHAHANDASPYLTGAKLFVKMFKTGQEPFSHARMLAPVAMLEGMATSLREKRPVKIADFAARLAE